MVRMVDVPDGAQGGEANWLKTVLPAGFWPLCFKGPFIGPPSRSCGPPHMTQELCHPRTHTRFQANHKYRKPTLPCLNGPSSLLEPLSWVPPPENTGVSQWPRGSPLGRVTGVAPQVNLRPHGSRQSLDRLVISCCCCEKLSQTYPLTFLEARMWSPHSEMGLNEL